jgi:hypothetical protein
MFQARQPAAKARLTPDSFGAAEAVPSKAVLKLAHSLSLLPQLQNAHSQEWLCHLGR